MKGRKNTFDSALWFTAPLHDLSVFRLRRAIHLPSCSKLDPCTGCPHHSSNHLTPHWRSSKLYFLLTNFNEPLCYVLGPGRWPFVIYFVFCVAAQDWSRRRDPAHLPSWLLPPDPRLEEQNIELCKSRGCNSFRCSLPPCFITCKKKSWSIQAVKFFYYTRHWTFKYIMAEFQDVFTDDLSCRFGSRPPLLLFQFSISHIYFQTNFKHSTDTLLTGLWLQYVLEAFCNLCRWRTVQVE